ncbi:MAG: spermine/spermidine synthase domain-containing protein [Candidatus Eutrophobiaceae bacterium]
MKKRYLLYIIFFFSGLSGLIYESVWSHYLKLFLGSAAYAQAVTLGIFMGGLAIGAWLSNRLLHRWKNLLYAYAAIELAIGITGLCFHPLFLAFQAFSYETVLPAIESPALAKLYKWSGAGLLIFPQSLLLGMTFPLMSNGFLRLFAKKPGGAISMLYFSNSLGAAVGVLLSGFVLIAWSGLPGTIMTAAIINVLVALGVWALAHSSQCATPRVWSVPEETRLHGDGRRLLWVVCAVAFFTGFASFVYEITWIRMLSLVLGASTHAFELMLSAFILGLALGGLVISRVADRIKDPLRAIAWIQIAMALCAVLTLPLYGHARAIMAYFLQALEASEPGYFFFNLFSHSLASLVMLPTTFCAGMTLPLLTIALARHESHGERSIGIVYAVNTVGSLIGVWVTVFIAMPVFGLGWALFGGAIIDMLVGMALFALVLRFSARRLLAPVAISVTLLATGLSYAQLDRQQMLTFVLRDDRLHDSGRKVLYYHDGSSATVQVGETKNGYRFIQTNGKSDAAVFFDADDAYADTKTDTKTDMETMLLLGLVPVALRPEAELAANIGFGSGITTHTLLATSKKLKRVDTIEIEPGMVEGAKYFMPFNRLAYQDPRSHIHFEDAKIFFADGKRKYDIIVSESSNPWSNGTSNLFTAEFYARIKQHLAEGGIFVQWLHIYSFNPRLLAIVVNALHRNFPYLQYWELQKGGDIILVASMDKLNFPENQMERLSQPNANLDKHFGQTDIRTSRDLWLRFIGNQELVSPWLLDVSREVNSDFFPLLDLGAVKARYLEEHVGQLKSFNSWWLPFKDWWYASAADNRLFSPWKAADGKDSVSVAQSADYLLDWILDADAVAAIDEFAEGRFNDLDWAHSLRAQLRHGERDCRLWMRNGATHFRSNIRVLLGLTLSSIPQNRNRELLKRIRAHACGGELAAWIDWYAALIEANMGRIETTAAHLMETLDDLSRQEKQSLLEARFAALIVMHEFQSAVDLFKKHQASVYGEHRLPKALEIPLAMALFQVNSRQDPSMADSSKFSLENPSP